MACCSDPTIIAEQGREVVLEAYEGRRADRRRSLPDQCLASSASIAVTTCPILLINPSYSLSNFSLPGDALSASTADAI